MSKWAETGLACPCGESSDAFCKDSNGNGFCFSGKCGGKFFRGDKEERLDRSLFTEDFYEHRGISKRILEKYNVRTKFFEETPVETAFFYPNGSIQIRNMAEKKFRTVGDYRNAHCFGTNIFDKGSKKIITITEGGYDALAVSQMLGEITASISIRSSSSAKADIIADFEYINSFDKIVINFDNDEPGQDAAMKVIPLFDFKKVYNLKLELGNDANDYLLSDLSKEYYKAWEGAKRYTPDNILSTMAEFRGALKEQREEKLVDYPFETLQQKLFGIHAGEVIVFKGDEGTGKTEVLRAIENQVFKTTKHNIAIIHLEEGNGTTLKAMAGYFSETPFLHPETSYDDDEIVKVLELIVGDKEDRFILHSSYDVEDEDKFISDIRFMVSANNCRFVFFDHISWLATGSEDKDGDERKKLDRISQRLKLLAKELNFALIMISHVNDDGKTRGSRNITKVANTVVHLTRNKTTEDESERVKLHMMVEKARLAGAKEGPAGFAVYDTDLLMLLDPLARGLQLPQ